MQWNEPGPAARPRILVFSAIGAVFGSILAIGLTVAVIRGVPIFGGTVEMSVLSRIGLLAWAVLAAGMAGISADIFHRTRQGPQARRSPRLRSEDVPLIVVLLAIGLVAVAFDAIAVDALLDGRTNAPVLVLVIVCVFGVLGVAGLLGAALVTWNSLSREPATLTLDSDTVPAGAPLDVRLEIPFPAERAPVATVSVVLTRWEAGATSGEPATSTAVWTQSVQIDAWEPVDADRSGAALSFDLPQGNLSDLPEERVSYVWGLDVRPVGDVAWNAQFRLPIRFLTESVA